jgi:hypothetical protein
MMAMFLTRTSIAQSVDVGVKGAVREVGVQQQHGGCEVGVPLCSRRYHDGQGST